MDLIKIKLPSFVEVEGFFYEIKTDFRAWLAFSRLIQDEATSWEILEKTIYLCDPPKDKEKGLKALLEFYNPPQELPRKTGAGSKAIILDYDIDADLIYSAFYEQYKIDLLETSLHWHKFLALLNGLHDTRLNEVMGYRVYDPNDKDDYTKQMQKLKNAWEIIPKAEKEKRKKARDKFNSLLEKKSK